MSNEFFVGLVLGFIVGKFARKAICLVRDFIIALRNKRVTVITLDDAEYGEFLIGVAKTEKQKWSMLWKAYEDYGLYFDGNGVLTRQDKDFVPYSVHFNLDFTRLNQYDRGSCGTTIGYEDEWKKPD